MKKLTSLLLTGLMIAGSISVSAATVNAAGDKSDFNYEITASGDAVITDYTGKTNTEIDIPGSIEGHKVTALGGYSFAYNNKIEKVTIPSSVKSIGYSAFVDCDNLTSVKIPDSVTSIRYSAFSDCEKLYDVALPSKITSIDDSLFRGTAVTEMNIPETVTSISDFAFANCEKLETIKIPDSVTSVGEGAFASCISLTSAKLSSNLTDINRVTFEGDTSLASITIPSKVKKIHDSAFAATGIKKVSISKNVTYLKHNVFSECFNLKSIKVASKNNHYSSKSGVLYNKKKSKLMTYPQGKTDEKFTVSEKVKTISGKAFYGAKLETVKFKKGLKTIKKNAFENTSLKTVKLPKTLEKIENSAFYENSSLKSISIPESVKEIESFAFSENPSLKTVKFKGSSKLKLGWGIFEACKSLKKISVPKTKSSDGGLCFACTNLKAVKISKDIKKIYRDDFAECRKLNKITIPKTVKKIGNYSLGYINYYDDSYDKNDNFIIKGYKNSAAQKYAKENGFTFKKLK